MRTFLVADIHGRLGQLEDVMVRSNFDKKEDQLIVLGDVCDGGEHTKAVVTTLLQVENLIAILGNHDWWFIQFMSGQNPGRIWLNQGGAYTYKSYRKGVPQTHEKFFRSMLPYYEDDHGIYVHGGFNPRQGVQHTPLDVKLWDRDLIGFEYKRMIDRERWIGEGRDPQEFDDTNPHYYKGKKVYVGHTCTQLLTKKNLPIETPYVVDIDTGAGHGDKLTFYERDEGKYYQSYVWYKDRTSKSEPELPE